MLEFTEELLPSFPPLITGHVYENHFRLQKYGKSASIEWIDIEENDAKIYNAGIYVSDMRWWDLNKSGKTVMNFPVGLAYATEVDLIVWTRNDVTPKVSIKISCLSSRFSDLCSGCIYNPQLLSANPERIDSVAKLNWLLSRPVEWKFEDKIFRFNAGHLVHLIGK